MDIQPVRNEADHAAALKEIDALWGAPIGTADGDKLDILITLVDRYESDRFRIADADPIEVIKAHMELTGRTQADLAKLLNSVSRASEVLNKRRALNIDMVHKLSAQWAIPAEYLVMPYSLDKTRNVRNAARRASKVPAPRASKAA